MNLRFQQICMPYRLGLSTSDATKLALCEFLVPSWSGKWEASILGKYLNLEELFSFASLVVGGRWEFCAVPSVSKTGITIELRGKAVSDKDLVSLPSLSAVHVVDLRGSRVTDSGLSNLARLTSLECVILSQTPVTSGGLEHLKALPKLRTLDVDGTSISDADLGNCGLQQRRFSLASVENAASDERENAPSDFAAVSVELVEINRRLAAMRPEACLPDLAISLNNLGWGRSSEPAVGVLREASEINRQLVVTRDKEFRGALFTSLSNLARVLEKLERHEEALAALQEAVDTYRQIPSTQPSTDVALALQRLGRLYSQLDRHEEAAQAALESVEMYRQRIAELPNAWMLHAWFVESLLDLGRWLKTLGRQEEALDAATEAVANARRLAETAPGSQAHLAATCLNSQRDIFTDLGRHVEARKAAEEAEKFSAKSLEANHQSVSRSDDKTWRWPGP